MAMLPMSKRGSPVDSVSLLSNASRLTRPCSSISTCSDGLVSCTADNTQPKRSSERHSRSAMACATPNTGLPALSAMTTSAACSVSVKGLKATSPILTWCPVAWSACGASRLIISGTSTKPVSANSAQTSASRAMPMTRKRGVWTGIVGKRGFQTFTVGCWILKRKRVLDGCSATQTQLKLG